MRGLFLTLVLMVLGGCVSQGYVDNYVDVLATDPSLRTRIEPLTTTPVVYRSADIERDAKAMWANGYAMLGYSSFVSEAHDPNLALGEARKVGASVVLHYSKYAGTVTGTLPFVMPTTTTSVTSLSGVNNGSVNGWVGSVPYSGNYQNNLSGNAVTTTYGSKTTYIPFAIQNFEVVATYWAKLKPPVFGASYDNVPVDVARKLGRNGAIVITNVRDASPAYFADVFPGDVITEINGQRVFGAKQFSATLLDLAGKPVVLKIYRSGSTIKKIVPLGK